MCCYVEYAWRHVRSGVHRNVTPERIYPLVADDPGFVADEAGNALNYAVKPDAKVVDMCGGTGVQSFFTASHHWPLYKKEASPLIQLISSLGIYIIIVQVIAIIWGERNKGLTDGC